MIPSSLQVSGFSISWLRCYDFGLAQNILMAAVENLRGHGLVQRVVRISVASETDEIDRDMFDMRYQERSKLLRLHLLPFLLLEQELGSSGRRITGTVLVDLLLDINSSFGVFNLSLSQPNVGDVPFTVEQIGFLTRQWLLPQDHAGRPQRLKVLIPGPEGSSVSKSPCFLYLREIMNYYFLLLHKALWEASPERSPTPPSWEEASLESAPDGCKHIAKLAELGLTRSRYPTSFGPVLDIWKIEGLDSGVKADSLWARYEKELTWLITDGVQTDLGEGIPRNEERSASRVFYLWPNHAIFINQGTDSSSESHEMARIGKYGCLDVEIVRILEILNLRSGILRASAAIVDQHLEQLSLIANVDQRVVMHFTEERRDILRSIQAYDFYNLFHTSRWERLYTRLLENPRLNFRAAEELIKKKLQYLNDEIQYAAMVQERNRQQQQREQQLDVLRGLHSLTLANDIQNNALMIINFVVSAAATFAFAEVLSPLLTFLSGAQPSFQAVYPIPWVALNVMLFLILALVLASLSFLLMRRKRQVIELEGQLNLAYDHAKLRSYLLRHRRFEYLHYNTVENSGFLRIPKRRGLLLIEFDNKQLRRYILFLQGVKPAAENLERLIRDYVTDEVKFLQNEDVIPGS